ncbi:hypothetical protein HG531_009687 [Fusarium graminearum]|nr:hypothetical protein HG531_009687 [Fusarium graminearum]
MTRVSELVLEPLLDLLDALVRLFNFLLHNVSPGSRDVFGHLVVYATSRDRYRTSGCLNKRGSIGTVKPSKATAALPIIIAAYDTAHLNTCGSEGGRIIELSEPVIHLLLIVCQEHFF